MRALERIRYNTMNSWNNSTAPAYNLKVYKVVDNDLQDKVYQLMQAEGFYDSINMLMRDFDYTFNHEWQAGFNGRSGGYLVLYRGGKHDDGQVYSQPGLSISDDEVPAEVEKAFRQLAIDIVSEAEYMAKHATIEQQEVTTVTTVPVINYQEIN
jgi:hypothetical protein